MSKTFLSALPNKLPFSVCLQPIHSQSNFFLTWDIRYYKEVGSIRLQNIENICWGVRWHNRENMENKLSKVGVSPELHQLESVACRTIAARLQIAQLSGLHLQNQLSCRYPLQFDLGNGWLLALVILSGEVGLHSGETVAHICFFYYLLHKVSVILRSINVGFWDNPPFDKI